MLERGNMRYLHAWAPCMHRKYSLGLRLPVIQGAFSLSDVRYCLPAALRKLLLLLRVLMHANLTLMLPYLPVLHADALLSVYARFGWPEHQHEPESPVRAGHDRAVQL